jgi:short-subunit dehydrogenase
MTVGSNRVVWITGASSGIGSALAELFARRGDVVAVSSRSESKLNAMSERISKDGGTCDAAVCDVTSELSVSQTAKKILAAHGKIDVLINNAGVTSFQDYISTSTEEFDQIVATNLRGVFLATQSVLPAMLQARSGLVLTILSFVVKEVFTKSAAYTASKAGAEAMMNVLRAEVRRQGINVVNVYPGATATPIWHPKQLEKYHEQMLKPQQIAEMIYQISIQDPSMMVEEVVLRPRGGNLQ